jgi:hypothetical protein
VFTAGGPRLAGSLRVGDRLLTHAGRYRAVIGRAVFDSQAMVTLAPWGVPEHAATALAPGTPVWARAHKISVRVAWRRTSCSRG